MIDPKLETRDPKPQTRRYRAVSLAFLAFALYGAAQPLLLPLLHRVLPGALLTCASQRWFGRPCPLCGLTRGIGALLHGDPAAAHTWNPLSLPVAALLAAETLYRIAVLIATRRRDAPARLIRTDLRLHALLALAYLAYAAGFAAAQLWP
ncbi:MAG: DUF2752 domain-containing protein [Lentisphaerae bacterium]|nr:DUF2752 domain-containing protein [Lentisphaerota bacterium]